MTTLVNSLSLRSFIRALQLIKYADRPAKRRLFLLIPIGLLSALAETAGLISIFPLLALLSDPSYIYSNKYLRTFVLFFDLEQYSQIVFIFSSIFIFLSLSVLFIKLFSEKSFIHAANLLGEDLSFKCFYSFLTNPSVVSQSKDNANMVSIIISDVDRVIGQTFLALIQAINSAIVLIILFLSISSISFRVVSISLITLAGLYTIVANISKKRSDYMVNSVDL